MIELRRIQTLQYMGNKSRMLESICTPILNNRNITKVVDLFAGTGSVGYALAPYMAIISNDLEYYSFVLNQALLNGCQMDDDTLIALMDNAARNYSKTVEFLKSAINEEEKFLDTDFEDYEAYAFFSNNTPSVFNPNTPIKSLSSLLNLIKRVAPGKKEQAVPFPCLFVSYYANAYFGIKQCCQIDALVTAINGLNDARQKNVALSALMSVMSVVASTTTHFAQYLKVSSKGTFQNIKMKRGQDIFILFSEAINRFASVGLLQLKESNHECYNLDYFECLKKIDIDENTVVYADPPYFKEHYSRYYHILNTLCFYDYPELAINLQLQQYSIGRYRTDRTVSDFGKRAKVLEAFTSLINACADKHAALIISYSDNSLVKIYELLRLAKTRYRVKVDKVDLKHSSQGRNIDSGHNVKEYIFSCDLPDGFDIEVEKKAERIRGIKPIVDNPAGFMHNYMARKPYNIISTIIQEFSSQSDVVYDPMFGSGTTLIEASKLGRKAIGADINPIAYKLCKVSLTKWDLSLVDSLIDEFIEILSRECSPIFKIVDEGEQRIIERCHFDYDGNKLIPVSYWYKTFKGDKLSGRKRGTISASFIDKYESYAEMTYTTIKNHSLIPNSRIAIRDGAMAFDYFCLRNIFALDKILFILENFRERYGYEILEIIVSSAMNLIKLSDKKASSQMPYWLPKTNVTSRNAVFVIQQKAQSIKLGLQYLDSVKQTSLDGENIKIYNHPAQSISIEELKDKSVDLVLTDPPYADQVPYLEYSQLWFDVFGFQNSIKMESELVISDAPSRNKNQTDFYEIFVQIVNRTARALKDGGNFIMFYHTFSLKSWAKILGMMQDADLRYLYQIPTAAPRKSFKTVMSPRSTLDGNYLLFFVKDSVSNKIIFTGEVRDAEMMAIACAERIIQSQERVTTQDLYDCGMLKESFEHGYLGVLAENYSSFADVIKNHFDYVDGYWKEKKCIGF